MKFQLLVFTAILTSAPTLISNHFSNPSHHFFVCDTIPELNKKIIEYVTTKINKQVGRGECWDVAAEALNNTKANWDGDYGFGKEVTLKKDCVYPGDIIQFSSVTVKYEKDKTFFIEKMQKHTAIIYEVKAQDDFILADQNTGTSGRKVGLHPLQLKNITSGKFRVYRPQQ